MYYQSAMTIPTRTHRLLGVVLLSFVAWQVAGMQVAEAQTNAKRRVPTPMRNGSGHSYSSNSLSTRQVSDTASNTPLKKTTWKAPRGESKQAPADATARAHRSNVSQVDHEILIADPAMTMVPQPMPTGSPCDGNCGGCDSCSSSGACDSMGMSHGQGCGCNRCCAANYWVRAEYLAWSLDGMELPPLVTTSTGTTPANTGILGGGTTRVLFGGDTINDDLRSGGRITLGWWADAQQSCGYEVGYLSVGRAGDDFSVNSTDVARIARPVFDTALNAESAMLVAHPDFLTGSLSITTESQLQSIDVIRRQCLRSSQWDRVDFLIGFKHGMLEELVRVDQSSRYTIAQGQILAGTTRQLFDRFDTDNQFDGLQLGLNWQRRNQAFTLSTLAKVSLGVNQSEVSIDGRTTNTVPGGGTGSFVGGLLAQSTNIGNYDDTNFIAVPELGVNLGVRISSRAQLSVGYNAMYWSKVARAGDQIDRRVSQFPPELPSGQRRPSFNFITDDLFIHGISGGLTYRF